MNSTKSKADNVKKVSINQLKNMDYMQMIEHYIEYPAKGLKYSFNQNTYSNLSSATTASTLGKNVKLDITDTKRAKTNFVTEKEKAEGWRDVYSSSKRNSKFLQTNLHYLPEHLWSKVRPFRQDNVDVGMKVSDESIHFFVHKADTDDLTRELFQLVQNKYKPDIVRIQEILEVFNEKGIESWLTIRANSLL
jgi:hypothetical protein